jgi:hypothetical protein
MRDPSLIAIGIRIKLPIATREKTITAGESSSTATLINKYGIPQRNPTNIKRNQLRLDIGLVSTKEHSIQN